LAFWTLGHDDRWRQKTLDEVRKHVADLVSKRSAAGHASALKRKETLSTPVQHNGQHNGNSKSEIKLAGKDEIQTEEELPSAWHSHAERKGIPDEQIYKSWRKFKDKTSHPYRLNNWLGWIERERVNA
jgi:hypothetical protein